jgi:hypothetical protein
VAGKPFVWSRPRVTWWLTCRATRYGIFLQQPGGLRVPLWRQARPHASRGLCPAGHSSTHIFGRGGLIFRTPQVVAGDLLADLVALGVDHTLDTLPHVLHLDRWEATVAQSYLSVNAGQTHDSFNPGDDQADLDSQPISSNSIAPAPHQASSQSQLQLDQDPVDMFIAQVSKPLPMVIAWKPPLRRRARQDFRQQLMGTGYKLGLKSRDAVSECPNEEVADHHGSQVTECGCSPGLQLHIYILLTAGFITSSGNPGAVHCQGFAINKSMDVDP